MTDLSVPLEELPTFLATVAMVGDDEREIVRRLTHAERVSPARYGPATQIFLRILTGDFSYDAGLAQARQVPDLIERDCAVGVLRAAKNFLVAQEPARLEPLPTMVAELPTGLELKVRPVWVRHVTPERLLVLHFWQSPLTPRQLGAAATILKSALVRGVPKYAGLEIDFVSAAIPERGASRFFHCLDWRRLAPLGEADFLKFAQRLERAWGAYQRIGPRPIMRRPQQPRLL